MPQSEDIALERFLGRFTLIAGEVNTGKTTLTGRVLDAVCGVSPGPVVVVDLAPEIGPRDLGGRDPATPVGGRVKIPESDKILLFRDRIHPPRLKAANEDEAETLARLNLSVIETLLEKASRIESEALFVNDCSLFLHAGDPERLLGFIRRSPTAVVNGYRGTSLEKYRISEREKAGMDLLASRCDRLIDTSSNSFVPFGSA